MIMRRHTHRQRIHINNHEEYYSRKLWDKTRQPDAPLSATLRAVLYELQPISCEKLNIRIRVRTVLSHMWNVQGIIQIIRILLDELIVLLMKLKSSPYKKMILIGFGLLYLYFKLVQFAHEKMDAGPIVLLFTALVMIFTIGLGDDGNNNLNGRISAYSVFNRGFARMLGNVDAEHLVAQHVGLQAPINRRDEMPDNNNTGIDTEQNIGIESEESDDDRTGPSRKSGKKARNRRNLEVRRDRQRQREMAREIGFVDDGNIDENDLAAINIALNAED